MTTINLEKELIKANKTVVSARELLFIKEYENAGEIDNSVLERVGITTLSEGKRIKDLANKLLDETKRFKQERVFHISQIKAICEKYYLRFLPSHMFNGSIDSQLAMKVSTFEAAYGVECFSADNDRSYLRGFPALRFNPVTGRLEMLGSDDDSKPTKPSNTFICAPAESFKLEQRPKDPLFFYQINSEYYYLVHKWGNDLSVFRQLKSILSSAWCPPIFQLLMVALSLYSGSRIGVIVTLVLSAFVFGFQFVGWINEKPIRWIKKNEWDSRFID